jgi:iron-sulfur cluster repair protein YtfE (RIC family)
MIRMDHTHTMAAFHRYKTHLSATRKQAIAEHICLALSIHAQLEEEIFYPALQTVFEDKALEKSKPEHDEMRQHMARLQELTPDHATYDDTLFALMRTVIHHVADEETVLLPAAERLLADQLVTLGAQMTKRRLQLLGPRLGQVARTGARTFPTAAVVAIVGALAAGTMMVSSLRHAESR